MSQKNKGGSDDRRHPSRRGGKPSANRSGRLAQKERPDFTRAEAYMRAPTPAPEEPTLVDPVPPMVNRRVATTTRRRALVIAFGFLMASLALTFLVGEYGPIVDGVAGVVAAFAIAATIHVLKPPPLLRFLMVVIALTCLSISFAMALHLHLHYT